MHIVQITPGAGKLFCGNCFRDLALVKALQGLGHSVLLVPLYLPLKLEEPDAAVAAAPIFFSGINVFIAQKIAAYRRAPGWVRRLIGSRALLEWVAGYAGTGATRPAELGEMTVSMLRGEDGRQAQELAELIAWLKQQGPVDAVYLSNALLAGMVRRLKAGLHTAVICTLQGEDAFLDGLPSPYREEAWRTLAERAGEADGLVAPSRFYRDYLSQRLGLAPARVRVVYNGIDLDGFTPAVCPPAAPVVGYLARLCPPKGLHLLVDAYLRLREGGRVPGVRLLIAGACLPEDEAYVAGLRQKLSDAGCAGEVSFHLNVTRSEKQQLLRTLSVLSVPVTGHEAFGLYLLEAWASGVPVVQPNSSAFPELIEATGGGRLFEAGNVAALAGALEEILRSPAEARRMGRAANDAVRQRFNMRRMAEGMVEVTEESLRVRASPPRATAGAGAGGVTGVV